MGKLDGKIAIITGGARGQGASHVRKFVKEGAKVVFTDILVEEGQTLEKELGESVKFIKHDVTSAKEWEHVVNETEKIFGPVNILVNNAGILKTEKIENLLEEDLRKVLDINLIGTFLGMKLVLPSMKKSENGSIINIASINAFRGTVGHSAYDASKFAVRGITKTAALEFAEYGIRVNSAHPGIVNTQMLSNIDKEMLHSLVKEVVPLKRTAKLEETSAMIAFLASDESGYSTGSEFIFDGGITASN